MDYLAMGAAAALIIALLAVYTDFRGRKISGAKTCSKNRTAAAGNHGFSKCPLCGHPLAKGENIVSKVYRPMNVPDQFCTISGCPYCWPICVNGLSRKCPVCGKSVPQDGSLTARLFNRTDGSRHVHITGCQNCHRTKNPDVLV